MVDGLIKATNRESVSFTLPTQQPTAWSAVFDKSSGYVEITKIKCK